jgi:hypothetical protein
MTAMKIGQTEESLQPDNLVPLKTISVCLVDSDVHVCDAQRHDVHLFLFPCLGDCDVQGCDT